VNVELELKSTASQDTRLLQDRIRKLFSLAKTAVDEELGTTAPAASDPKPTGEPPKAGTGSRPASDAQKRAIRVLCDKLGLDVDRRSARGSTASWRNCPCRVPRRRSVS
jgi:hypothetical protein